MKAYQKQLYGDYAHVFGGGPHTPDGTGREGPTLPVFRHYLRGWLPEDRGAKILDAGCGSGRNLRHFRELGFVDLTGVDWSESQVDLARDAFPGVTLGDALEFLRDTKERFDLITGFDLIEHLSKEQALEFLALSFERLQPGGRLVLQTPNASSPFFGSVRYGDLTHELGLTPSLISKLLGRAGFTDVEVREAGPVPRGYGWKSAVRSSCWAGIRGMCSLVELVETGRSGGVYTRVFFATGRRGR